MTETDINSIYAQTGRSQWYALVVGGLATVGCVLGAVFDWDQFLRSYLFAYLFVLGLSIGSLALVMIHNLTGGAWGLLVRRLAEAQMKLLPLTAILSLPLVFGLKQIYAWANIEVASTATDTGYFWRHYLEPWFFYLRAAVYFIVWTVLIALMSAWSRGQDRSPSVGRFWWAYKLSGFGLVLLGVTVHFAAMDWIMSLQRGFTSTVFGPLIFSNQVLSSFALCVLLFCWLVARPELAGVLSSKAMNDLGSLLLVILVLWAYLSWFQFMLIWMADLPHGNVWYLVRWRGTWGIVGGSLVLVQFVVPFFALLLRTVKQSRRALAAISGLIFVDQWIFMYYQVAPLFGGTGWKNHWIDVLTPLALGGIWFAAMLWLLKRRPLVPRYDLNYQQAILLHEIDEQELAREEVLAHE